LFSIGFTISVNSQVNNGLGSKLSTVRTEDYENFQKAGYTWNILYILGICLAKLSTLSLLLALAPNKSYRVPMLVIGGVLAAWAIASIFSSAFQCSLPHPYLINTGTCFHQTRFWASFGVINIIADAALMILPVYLVYNLQLSVKKKTAVCFAFSFRVLEIGCTIWRLTQLEKFFDRNADVTFDSWLPTIATVLELFFGVFSSCVPHLRPFMESIQAGYLSGVMTDGDPRFGYGNDSYLMGKTAQSKVASQVRSQHMKSELRGESLDLPRHGTIDAAGRRDDIGQALTSNRTVHTVRGGPVVAKESLATGRNRSESLGSDGAVSHGSDGSKAMIIKTTKEWSVSYQDA